MPFASSTLSSTVDTVSVAVVVPEVIVTVVGAVPLIKLPLSVTLTFTVRLLAGVRVAVTVKVASAPSVTDAVSALMLTEGRGRGRRVIRHRLRTQAGQRYSPPRPATGSCRAP